MSHPGGLLSLAKAASWSVVRQAATLRHTCVVSRDAIFCDSSFSSPYWFLGFSTTFALQCLWRTSRYYSTMNHLGGQLILLSFQMSVLLRLFYLYSLCCVYCKAGDADQTRTHQTVSHLRMYYDKHLRITRKTFRNLVLSLRKK